MKVRVTGTCTFSFSRTLEVDDDTDLDNFDYPLYLDEVQDYSAGDEEIEIQEVHKISKK